MDPLKIVPMFVLALVLAAVPARADDVTPPTTATFRVLVIDAATGQPVPGVTVEATELKRVFRCYGDDCSVPCQEVVGQSVLRVTSGPDGVGTIIFHLDWCELYDDDPVTWIKELHDGWGAPRMIDDPAAGLDSPWAQASWSIGDGEFDQVIRVTAKAALAEAFAPVLHRHAGYELQQDLGDVTETMNEHAILEAFNVQGQRVFGPVSPPPLHNWNDWHWDSFGWGQTPTYWRLDIDDPWRHLGAAPGHRPLYYHVRSDGDGALVQYWLWFNANDLREQWGFAFHEGDWEYAALRVRFDGTGWAPVMVNLSEHKGGMALPADSCWWTPTREPSYAGLRQGWSPGRDHPHFWVASNSHALYNRFAENFHLDLNDAGDCHGIFDDQADYNITDNPAGDHSFFPYDRLEPMGEFWHTSHAHGYTWFDHLEGGPLEPLRFVGRFGEGACDAPGDCLDIVCSIIAGLDGGTYQLAPRSPVIPDEPHKWAGFVDTPGPWGNDQYRVSFADHPQKLCYGGRYATCADGSGDTIRFRVPTEFAHWSAVARIHTVDGFVFFLREDNNREFHLGVPVNGAWVFSESRVIGTGRVAITVYPHGAPDFPSVDELYIDVVDGACSLAGAGSGVPPTPRSGNPVVTPSPTRGPVRIRLADGGGVSPPGPGLGAVRTAMRRVRICDVGGREIWSAMPRGDERELAWDTRGADGAPVPSGVYLVYEERVGLPARAGRVVVVR